jgi:AcrR family transcriptional regulator
MPTPSESPAVRGRPRSERAKHAVLKAARALVEKAGYSAATIEAIAARSGVAKTTIYRWWPNRAALVVDLLVDIAGAAAPPPSGEDPLGALHTELRLVAQAAEGLSGRLLISLLGEAEHDPDVHEALVQRLFTPRRVATAKVIREAQASGALRGDVPPRLAGDLLYGPLFYRKFVRHEPVTRAFANQVFEVVLAGLGAGSEQKRPKAAMRDRRWLPKTVTGSAPARGRAPKQAS